MKAFFLINERSGRKRRRDLEAVLRDACDWPGFSIAKCGQREDLDELLRKAIAEEHDTVIAVGGDGTVHEIAARLIGTDIALGILPTGSGNGMARHLGIPMRMDAALSALRDAPRVAIDTATVNGRRFVGVMGVGFDAAIAHRFAQHAARGLATYVRAGLTTIGGYEAEEYDISVDGRSLRSRALVVAIANSGQYGNEAKIAPRASMRDGLLDVVIVEQAGLVAIPGMLARLFTGSFDRCSDVTTLRGREVTIRRGSAGHAHLDGEPLWLPEELTIAIAPASLQVLVPDSERRI